MCVAVVVFGESPSHSELCRMEDDNPHGGGMAWAVDGGIAYVKGLTAAEMDMLLSIVPRPVLLHYRWATHGGQSKPLTHPFPMGERALRDPSLSGIAPKVLIHNGVWGSYKEHQPDWIKETGIPFSDTSVAAFAADTDEDILHGVAWSTAVMEWTEAGPKVRMRGNWIKKSNMYVSNEKWKNSKLTSIGSYYYTGSHGSSEYWHRNWDR